MRIALLVARSGNTVGIHSFRPSLVETRGLLERDLEEAARNELASNDWCFVCVAHKDHSLDDVLSNKDLVRQIYKAIKTSVDESFDLQIKLHREFGYMLRLASFAALLRELVNSDEDLKGSTVIADVT